MIRYYATIRTKVLPLCFSIFFLGCQAVKAATWRDFSFVFLFCTLRNATVSLETPYLFMHYFNEWQRANKDQMSRLKCRLHNLSTFSLWLCSSFRVVLLHVSTPESFIWGSDHSKSSSKEWPPKHTIFFCLSDKVLESDKTACSLVFLFPLWLSPIGVG